MTSSVGAERHRQEVGVERQEVGVVSVFVFKENKHHIFSSSMVFSLLGFDSYLNTCMCYIFSFSCYNIHDNLNVTSKSICETISAIYS